MANHLRLDLNVVERLAVVDSNDAADHFWDDDHVAQVRPHSLGLVSALRRLRTNYRVAKQIIPISRTSEAPCTYEEGEPRTERAAANK